MLHFPFRQCMFDKHGIIARFDETARWAPYKYTGEITRIVLYEKLFICPPNICNERRPTSSEF